MQKRFLLPAFSAGVLILISCSKGSSTSGGSSGGGGGTNVDCSTINAKFAADVAPIISSSCAINGCHNGSQTPTLTTYAQISANASSISSQVQSGAMPKNSTLSTTQKNIIKCWVQSGAPNN